MITQHAIEGLLDSASIGDVLEVTHVFQGIKVVYQARVRSKERYPDGRWRIFFEDGRYLERTHWPEDEEGSKGRYRLGAGVVENAKIL